MTNNTATTATATNTFARAKTIQTLRNPKTETTLNVVTEAIKAFLQQRQGKLLELASRLMQDKEVITIVPASEEIGLMDHLQMHLLEEMGLDIQRCPALMGCVQMEVQNHLRNFFGRYYKLLPSHTDEIRLTRGTPTCMAERDWDNQLEMLVTKEDWGSLLQSLYIAAVKNKDINFDAHATTLWEVLLSAHAAI